MKIGCFCFIASVFAFSARGQHDSVSLPGFSSSRTASFLKQQEKVKTYSVSRNTPIIFKDEYGNAAHIVDITPSGLPVYRITLNAGAATTTNVDQLRSGGTSGLNLEGAGMLIGVWDEGIVKDHIELGTRVIAKEGTADDNHSTHVTGTLIATGLNPAARGMAPLAHATTHDFDNDEAEMAGLAKPDATSLLFSNHSYGTATGWFKHNGVWEWTGDPAINLIEDYRFGFYDTRAQDIDQIAYLAPYYTIVWAAGNDRADVGNSSKPADCNGGSGYDCIIPEAVSKNIITVGAVYKVPVYSSPYDVTMSSFSSWGPTDDGRIKPDLVGAGVNLFSLSSIGSNTYTTLSGTSMATPNVAGSLLLIQELYSKLHGGDFMKAATLKALAIHTTMEAGNFPGPDYSFGWGLLDVASAAKILVGQDDQSTVVKELVLQNGSSYSFALHPKANQKITATIVWTDPPATPVAPSVDPTILMLVNDLDLRIIDELGREQLPWNLDPSNPNKQASRADNFRDNVEKIEFEFPEAKDYSLVVRHKGNLATAKQDFSLIVSYQPVLTSQVFYWIGDSGDWNDGTHWALTSNGSPSMSVPGPDDRVIVDENSFDGIGPDGIALTQDVSCASLLWLNSKASGVSLNNNTLSISTQLVIGDSNFSIQSQGKISFVARNAGGTIFATSTNLTGASLIFGGGTWTTTGNFKADELQLTSDTLKITNGDLILKRLIGSSAPAKLLQLDHAGITLLESSTLDGGTLAMTSDYSYLRIPSGIVNLLWQSVNFPGALKISPSSQLTIGGSNKLGRIYNQGTVHLSGSNVIDTLIAEAGAEIMLGPSTIQTLSAQTQLTGTLANHIVISSPTNSTLLFPDHSKLCFDYLTVTNVGVEGDAVVNAGSNSALLNALQWQQKECSDVLFADFEAQYTCAGGLTEFRNKSTGNILTYSWRFPEESHAVDPVKKFYPAGNYDVSLIVTDNGSADSVTKSIAIVENPVPSNTIISAGETLMSFEIGSQYQWFKDGVAVGGASSRSYLLDGSVGVYFVLSYNGECNILSDTVTVTGLTNERQVIEVYPNPASTNLVVKVPESPDGNVTLTDLLGRNYLVKKIEQSESAISTEFIPNGVYVLQINSNRLKVRRKVVILH